MEELTAAAIRVVALLVAALFVVAIAHKVRVIASGSARSQPLVQLTEFRRRHATVALLVATTLEAVVVAALVIVPLTGLASALVLLGYYSFELRKLAPEASCDCFGNFMKDTGTAAVRRNIALCAACAVMLGVALAGIADPADLSQGTIGVALIVAAGVFAADVLGAVTRPAGIAPDHPRKGGGLAS